MYVRILIINFIQLMCFYFLFFKFRVVIQFADHVREPNSLKPQNSAVAAIKVTKHIYIYIGLVTNEVHNQ